MPDETGRRSEWLEVTDTYRYKERTTDPVIGEQWLAEDRNRFVLSERDAERLLAVLENPPEPTPAFVEAARRAFARRSPGMRHTDACVEYNARKPAGDPDCIDACRSLRAASRVA